MTVRSTILPAWKISPARYEAMLSLMQEYYENVDPRTFEEDLNKKDLIIVLEAEEGLCGFSTQALFEHKFGGKRYRILFSGDTIVRPRHRNSMALPIAGGKMMMDILQEDRSAPLYWLLTSKGYRTYKFLPLFFKEYFPGRCCAPAESEKLLIEDFCTHYFREKFDRENWLIKAGADCQRLNNRDGDITDSKRKNLDVAFFERKNPGHFLGDELVCFAEFRRENINPLLWKHLVEK